MFKIPACCKYSFFAGGIKRLQWGAIQREKTWQGWMEALHWVLCCDGEQILQEVQRFPDNFMFVYQQEKFNGSSTDSHTTIIPAL